jgi:hypothetical protein
MEPMLLGRRRVNAARTAALLHLAISALDGVHWDT